TARSFASAQDDGVSSSPADPKGGAGDLSWRNVYQAVGAMRRVFRGSPHEPRELLSALEALPGIDETWSIKTTGAGGEDALLLFGDDEAVKPALRVLHARGWEALPVAFASRSVEVIA